MITISAAYWEADSLDSLDEVDDTLLVDVIGDSTQLKDTLTILEESGQIDAESAAIFRQTNAELAKKKPCTKQSARDINKQIPTLYDVEKSLSVLADLVFDTMSEGFGKTEKD